MNKNTHTLDGLSESQKEVVLTHKGVVTVNSGAGSGKTRCIVRRIANMIENGISADKIMLTTFTKLASKEMTDRLSSIVSYGDLQQLTIGTTHSICYKILLEEYEAINHNYLKALKNPKTNFLSDGRLKVFVDMIHQDMIKSRKSSYDENTLEELSILEKIKFGVLISNVSSQKNKGITYEEYKNKIDEEVAIERVLADFYEKYEQKKWSEQKMDFDDLLLHVYKLFKSNEDILSKYQRRWEYIITDESQDQNHVQNELIRMLAHPHNNICLVGDVSQSIYGFRGAKPEEFLYFSKGYDNTTELFLLDNYRSRKHVVDTANKVIRNNTIRIDKDAVANRQDETECVRHLVFDNELGEAKYVVDEIDKVIRNRDIKYSDISVLYRTNAQSKSVEDELIEKGLPYVIHNGFSFYKRKEILDILSYLKLAIDNTDNVSFKRVINVPNRFLGKAFVEMIENCRGNHWDSLNMVRLKPFQQRSVDEFQDLVLDIKRKMKNKEKLNKIIDYIMIQGRYNEVLLKDMDTADEKMENIQVLKNMASKYDNVIDFLEYIAMMQNKRKDSINGVQLMSIHGSKGLEFDTVFLIGMNEGLLPHTYATDDLMACEEERRLAYVGITRAENWLYMTSCDEYNGRYMGESRFIEESGIKTEDMRDFDYDNEEWDDEEDEGMTEDEENFMMFINKINK